MITKEKDHCRPSLISDVVEWVSPSSIFNLFWLLPYGSLNKTTLNKLGTRPSARTSINVWYGTNIYTHLYRLQASWSYKENKLPQLQGGVRVSISQASITWSFGASRTFLRGMVCCWIILDTQWSSRTGWWVNSLKLCNLYFMIIQDMIFKNEVIKGDEEQNIYQEPNVFLPVCATPGFPAWPVVSAINHKTNYVFIIHLLQLLKIKISIKKITYLQSSLCQFLHHHLLL